MNQRKLTRSGVKTRTTSKSKNKKTKSDTTTSTTSTTTTLAFEERKKYWLLNELDKLVKTLENIRNKFLEI